MFDEDWLFLVTLLLPLITNKHTIILQCILYLFILFCVHPPSPGVMPIFIMSYPKLTGWLQPFYLPVLAKLLT